MDDFKKLPKMKTGGCVKKMADGGSTGRLAAGDLYGPGDVQKLMDMGHYVDQNISRKEANTFDKALNIDRSKPDRSRMGLGNDYTPKSVEGSLKTSGARSSGTGGGAGYVPGSKNPFNPDSLLNRKKGGRVTKKVGTVKKNK
jgi:hypothetical protein